MSVYECSDLFLIVGYLEVKMRDIKVFKLLMLSALSLIIVSCTNSGSNNSGNGNPPPTFETTQGRHGMELTISDLANIPQIGNSPTTGTLYIHNHSNAIASNIDIKVVNKGSLSFKINNATSELCQSLDGGKSCPINFTGEIDSKEYTASVEIQLSYTINNKHQVFSQSLNFEKIIPNADSGLVLNPVKMNSYGNKNAYGVVYLYNASAEHKSYNIKNLKLTPGLKIINGDIYNIDFAPGAIHPIEIQAPVSAHAILAELSVDLTHNDNPNKPVATTLFVNDFTSKPSVINSLGHSSHNSSQLASASTPLLTASFSPTSVVFPATSKGKTTLTLRNSGAINVNLTGISIGASSGATGAVDMTNSTCKDYLQSGKVCTYIINLERTTEGSGKAAAKINGTYLNGGNTINFSTVFYVDYIAMPSNSAVVVLGEVQDINIAGNGIESSEQLITVFNLGNVPAKISRPIIYPNSNANLTIAPSNRSDSCTDNLPSQKSCTLTLKLNPVYSELGESGTPSIQMEYSGVETGSAVASTDIKYNITPANTSLKMSAPEEVNGLSPERGNGESSTTPYVFYGSTQSDNQWVKFTYENNGNTAFTITKIDISKTYTTAWQIDENRSSCKVGMRLSKEKTCIVYYVNQLSRTNALGSEGFRDININVPKITVKTDANREINFTPPLPNGKTMLYVTAKYAVVKVGSIRYTKNSSNNYELWFGVDVSGVIDNYTGYSYTVNKQFATNSSKIPDCSQRSGGNVVQIDCAMPAVVGTQFHYHTRSDTSFFDNGAVTINLSPKNAAGTYMYLKGASGVLTPPYQGLAFISFDDGVNSAINACPVNFGQTVPKIDTSKGCFKAFNRLRSHLAIRQIGETNNLLIAGSGDEGGIWRVNFDNISTWYAFRITDPLPYTINFMTNPISRDGGGYIFSAGTGDVNGDNGLNKDGFMSYAIDQNFRLILPVNEITTFGAKNLTYINDNWTPDAITLIGHAYGRAFRLPYECLTKCIDMSSNVSMSNPYRMLSVTIGGASYTFLSGYNGVGGLDMHEPKGNEPFGGKKTTVEPWPKQISDIKEDKNSNGGIFVISRFGQEVCWVSPISMNRNNCTDLTTIGNNPVAIEIVKRPVYR